MIRYCLRSQISNLSIFFTLPNIGVFILIFLCSRIFTLEFLFVAELVALLIGTDAGFFLLSHFFWLLTNTFYSVKLNLFFDYLELKCAILPSSSREKFFSLSAFLRHFGFFFFFFIDTLLWNWIKCILGELFCVIFCERLYILLSFIFSFPDFLLYVVLALMHKVFWN